MTTTSPESANAIARRFTEELWDRGDLSVADDLLSPDFVDHDPVSGQGPGRDGYKEMVGVFRTAFPDLRVRNEDVIVGAEGDKVVLRWSAHGRNTGEFLNMPATGRGVRLKGVDILRLRDGKIIERWGEFDALGMLNQLGVIAQ